MRRAAMFLIASLALFGAVATAQTQVAGAEFQGVDTTLPHSPGPSGWVADGSVGEARVLVKVVDAAGNPVEGAQVTWTVNNSTDNVAYVVATSAEASLRVPAYNGRPVEIDGGTTDAEGLAFLVLDSLTPGDANAAVTADGVAAKTYDGNDMRVVWF